MRLTLASTKESAVESAHDFDRPRHCVCHRLHRPALTMLSSPSATVVLVALAGGTNVLRDHVQAVILIVLFMLAAKTLLEQKTSSRYRCLRCGASRKDMHSIWCEDAGRD